MQKNSTEKIKIRVIKSIGEFQTLEADWRRLLVQSDADNIFLTWEWINCWLLSQKKEIRLVIIVLEQAGKVIAIAPFYIQIYSLVSLVKYYALRFVGDRAAGSEYPDFIVNRSSSVLLKKRVWQALLSPEIKGLWDFIWFPNVALWQEGGKTLADSLTAVKKLPYQQRVAEFALVVLPEKNQEILTRLSKSLRSNIGQTARRLDKLGPWKMDLCGSACDLDKQLETLFYLHNKHWKDAGLAGSFQRSSELQDFYRLFVPLALKKNWLKLFYLQSNNKIEAIQLGYLYNNSFLALQEGYNPDFLAGSGQVLRHFVMTYCIQHEIGYYDFLGVYTDHKRRWLAQKKEGADLFIWQSKIKNAPFYLRKIWPTGAYLRPVN